MAGSSRHVRNRCNREGSRTKMDVVMIKPTRARSAGKWSMPGILVLAAALGLSGQATTPSPAFNPAPGEPVVTYSRSFKGSQPAFLQVEVARNGQAEFEVRMADGQPMQTLVFTASPRVVAQVFALTRKAKEFSRPLEDRHDKVGYTGTKMLAYDDAGQHHQQVFNFTRVKPAADLQGLFEAIGDTGTHALRLQESARYDPLGVVKELGLIAVDWNENQMAEPSIILPVLRQVSANTNLMDIARKRARILIQRMTGTAKAGR